jgi:integrase
MAKALTIKAIENIKPGAVRREIPDGEVTGLYLQVFPSGKMSWAFRYRFGGRSRKLTIGLSPEIGLKDARNIALKAHVQVAGGTDPQCEKQTVRRAAKQAALAQAPNDIIEKIAAQFMARHVKNLAPSTQGELTRIINRDVLPAWRGRRLSEITQDDVHDLLDAIRDRGAPVYANRVLSWLKVMAQFAVKQLRVIGASPFVGLDPPTKETARDRVLTDSELKAVWLASDSLDIRYSAFVKLLILSGQRRNEVSEIRWSELDLDAGIWTLPKERAKNDREHQIPLPDPAVSILRAVPKIAGSDYVLTLDGRGPIRGYSNIKTRIDAVMPSDVPPWTLHDLRRTFATGMAKRGVAIHVTEALLNHRSGVISGIVAVYQKHDYASERRTAMATWANYVASLVSGETASNVRYIAKL